MLLLALYLGGCWYFSNLVLNPPAGDPAEIRREMAQYTGAEAQPVMDWLSIPEEFEVVSPDGSRISGWYFRADTARCGIIMAHGWSGNRLKMHKYFPLFADCACDMVTFDHRGHSQSEDTYATGGIREAEDLLAVTDWYQDRSGMPDSAIGWLGISWGGATVLQAGATDEDVAFIVSDSPFQDWNAAVMERAIRDYGSWIRLFVPTIKAMIRIRSGVRFEDANARLLAADIEEPVFLIHSAGDSATASIQSVNISKVLNPEKSVFHHTQWGNGHGNDIDNNPQEFKALLQSFLAEKVPEFGACD